MRQLQVGETIEGRYVIKEFLASGGQAHVYRGQHRVLGRPVAIKLLKPGATPEVTARMTRRFEREAKVLSGLRDPHTITLYDFGTLGGGSLFMVFEFIDGESLKECLQEHGALAPHRVAKILRQTLSSLQEAHSMGMLHRDLKPANIMLYEHARRADQVKLLDFGIAKIVEDSAEFSQEESLTGAGNLVGTPRYIAPEYYSGSREDLSPASDLYSLGLVAYELLVGKPAVPGATPVDILRFQMKGTPIRLPPHLDIPQGLRDVVDTLLKRSLAERYSSAEQVLWDMRHWQRQRRRKDDTDHFDPHDLSIPDPYEDVAPTQNLSSDALEELALPQVEVEPLNATEAEVTPRGADSTHADRIPEETTAGMDISKVLQDRRVQQAQRREEDSRTEILENAPDIDALLTGATSSPSDSAQPSTPASDDTMRVDVSEALAADAQRRADEATQEQTPARQQEADPAEADEDESAYAAPDDETAKLTEMPPLKKSAVLRRPRRRRRRRDRDDDSEG